MRRLREAFVVGTSWPERCAPVGAMRARCRSPRPGGARSPRHKRYAWMLCSSLLLAGCRGSGTHAGPDGGWARRTIPGLALTLPLPPAARLSTQPGGVLIEMRPGARSSQTLQLSPASAPRRGALAGPQRRLAAGVGTLHFQRTTRPAVGSGGEEIDLEGYIQRSDGWLAVACHDQAEGGPSLDWCLALLDELRTDPGP